MLGQQQNQFHFQLSLIALALASIGVLGRQCLLDVVVKSFRTQDPNTCFNSSVVRAAGC